MRRKPEEKNAEPERPLKLVGEDFDGWFIDSADGIISPFKHENDVAKTCAFFGRFQGFSAAR